MAKRNISGIFSPIYGYDVTEEGKYIPLETDLELLQEVKDLLEIRAISLRDAATWMSAKGSRKISYEGLRKRLRQPVRCRDDQEAIYRTT